MPRPTVQQSPKTGRSCWSASSALSRCRTDRMWILSLKRSREMRCSPLIVLCLPCLCGIVQGRRETKGEKVPYSCGQEFSSDNAKNGNFTSPNYPEPYPAEVFCVYSFTGRGKERVQIHFMEFDLHLPHEPPRDCDSVDAVMVFITINGQKERVDNFCGNKLPAQLMSNGPSMIVEFRSHHSSPEVKGFIAHYRFVTDFGITGPRQDSASVCAFVYHSDDRTNGTFISPNFPGLYPRDTECHYFFQGKPKERVHIKFSRFDVDGIPPCTTDTASDYVEFSNYRTVDRKIPRHCGVKKPKVLESDGDFFRVTFKSNDKFDGTGFEAQYHFKPFIDPATVKRISSTTVKSLSNVIKMTLDLLLLLMVPNVLQHFVLF